MIAEKRVLGGWNFSDPLTYFEQNTLIQERENLVRAIPAVFLAFLFMSCTVGAQARSKTEMVDRFLKEEMQKRHIPGLQVAIVQHGKIVLAHAYGLADVEHSIPATNQTVFSIASITKAFTGVAIMQLVEQGRVNLDASVSQYLDGLPASWQPVTIRQLLTHTSGIPDLVDQKTGKVVGDGSPETFMSKANELPMDFATGDKFRYNQTNYLLLSKVVEKMSGESYPQYVRMGQLDVVGMPGSEFGGFSDIIKNRAQPYGLQHGSQSSGDSERLINIFYESVPALVAGNGLNSTATELARWVIALQHKQLLKNKASIGTMWTPGVLNNGSTGGFGGPLNGYGLGWPVVTRPTHRAVAPIGGNWAALFIYPDDDLSVVILTNLQGAHPEAFADELAGYFVQDISNAVGFGIPRAIKSVEAQLTKRGFENALEVVNEPANTAIKDQLREADINAWGYRLMGQNKKREALEVFKLNVVLFPESANVYDSLADAYEGLSQPDLAIQNYKRSLKLNPQNQNAVERLKLLQSNSATRALP